MSYSHSFEHINTMLSAKAIRRKSLNRKRQKVKLRLIREKQFNTELLTLSEEELLAILEMVKAVGKQTVNSIDKDCLEKWLRYGTLTPEQRKHIKESNGGAAAIADGLGGILIPINLIRTIVDISISKITEAVFLTAAGVATTLGVLGGSVVIYSLYSGAKAAHKKLITKLKLANFQQKLLNTLNVKLQQKLADNTLAVLEGIDKVSKNNIAICEELIFFPEYQRLKILQEEAKKDPDNWFVDLTKKVGEKDLEASKNFVALQNAIQYLSNKDNLANISRHFNITQVVADKQKVAQPKSALAGSLLPAVNKNVQAPRAKITTSIFSKIARPFKRIKHNIVKMENTLPGVTMAGVSFTMFAGVGLGGAAFFKTAGFALGMKSLGMLGLALTGPYGLIALGGISLVAGVYFGYKYYCKFKELEAAKRLKKQVNVNNGTKYKLYNENKKLNSSLEELANTIRHENIVVNHKQEVAALEVKQKNSESIINEKNASIEQLQIDNAQLQAENQNLRSQLDKLRGLVNQNAVEIKQDEHFCKAGVNFEASKPIVLAKQGFINNLSQNLKEQMATDKFVAVETSCIDALANHKRDEELKRNFFRA